MSPVTSVRVPHVLLPIASVDVHRWAVIACDQFTSQPEYWAQVEEIVGDAPSTLRLVLPELHLGSPDVAKRVHACQAAMHDYLSRGLLEPHEAIVYVERGVSGGVQRGLLVEVDLEAYDYSSTALTPVRSTEGTVLDRLPPRMAVRRDAPLELPHIMVLYDDPYGSVLAPVLAARQELPVAYDVDLMLGSGHLTGRLVQDPGIQAAVFAALGALVSPEAYEARYGLSAEHPLQFAMGDGNHSLATAKAAWEQLKQTLTPEEIETHPARYALCEIENIHDESMIFEPIHRVLFGRKAQEAKAILDEAVELLDAQNGRAYVLEAGASSKNCAESRSVAPDGADFTAGAAEIPEGAFKIPYLYGDKRGIIVIEEPSSKLEVGALQNALDVMVKERKSCDIDYIHGSETLERLAAVAGNVGFLLPSMDKFMLFPAVAADGALPRKTFSMGEANEKRYYIEARRILK